MERTIKRFLFSPLFHFLLAGFFIFATSYYIGKSRDAHRIIIDKKVVDKLVLSWQTQFGKMPTDRELKIAIDDYVKQEVLYREAETIGLEKDDEIIKRRLQQKMSFILKDNLVVPDPNEQELDTYYKKNAEKFADPPKVSFSHIYFSSDNETQEKTKGRAAAVLQQLQSEKSRTRGPELGDRFMLLYDYNDVSESDVKGLFGDSPFTDTLFTAKENQWSGPFMSGYGFHLLYINKRLPAAIPALATDRKSVV